ncbi:MAG: hypothetical protein VB824_06815, partial [Dehalococcoidia bacterium]
IKTILHRIAPSFDRRRRPVIRPNSSHGKRAHIRADSRDWSRADGFLHPGEDTVKKSGPRKTSRSRPFSAPLSGSG